MIFNQKESKYRKDYAYENVTHILNHVERGINISLIRLRGSGLSNILRSLTFNKSLRRFHNIKDSKKFVYVDVSSMFEETPLAFSHIFIRSIIDSLQYSLIREDEVAHLLQELSNINHIQTSIFFLDKLVTNLEHAFILLDDFEKILKTQNSSLLSFLYFLRNRYSNIFTFIFSIENQTYDLIKNDKTEFLEIINHKTVYTPLYNKREFSTLLNRFNNPDIVYSKEFISKLYKETGGYASYLKVFETFCSLENLEKVNHVTEKLLNSLTTKQKESLLYVYSNKTLEIDDYTATKLKDYGIIEYNGKEVAITSKLLVNYINDYGIPFEDSNSKIENFTKKLSKNESKVFSMFYKSMNSLVTKDSVGECIWGAHIEGKFSQWSIDQLIKRIRDKIKEHSIPYELETKRSRGYILKKISNPNTSYT